MKENRAHWFLSWLTGRGTYQETKFEEDARAGDRVSTAITVTFGRRSASRNSGGRAIPRTRRSRWVELHDSGQRRQSRYRVSNFQIAGNTVVKTEALKPLFKLKNGDYYNQKLVRKGFQKAQEIYGAGGYMEFTGYPGLQVQRRAGSRRAQYASGAGAVTPTADFKRPPTVDVTLQIEEGKQYLVNRITLHRQHDHPRQRHPSRAAAVREGMCSTRKR